MRDVRIVSDTTRFARGLLIFDVFEEPEIHADLFGVVQDRLRLQLRYLMRFQHGGTEFNQLRLIELPRFVIDARAIEPAFVFGIEKITLRKKELARAWLR